MLSSRKRGAPRMSPQFTLKWKFPPWGCPHDPPECIFSCQLVLEGCHCRSGSQCDSSYMSLNQFLFSVAREIQLDMCQTSRLTFLHSLSSLVLSVYYPISFFSENIKYSLWFVSLALRMCMRHGT